MRLPASASLLLLCAALLVGCVPPAPDSSGSAPSPSSTQAPSAEPTPTPTPPPAADPDDPSTWLITDDGMGPIELGAPFDAALESMPQGTRHDTENCAWTAWWNGPDGGSQVYLARSPEASDDGPVENVTTAGWSDPVSARGPRTAEGIGVGSSVDEVRAAYPEATVVPDSVASTIGHLQVGQIFFTYREAPVITSVTVTTSDVPPYELCG